MSDRHFLTALRSYLEQLATAPQPPDHEPTISSAWAQALFVRTLERVALGESKRTSSILADLDGYLQDWLGKDQGVRFIQRWDELLRGSFAHSTPLSERQRLLEVGAAEKSATRSCASCTIRPSSRASGTKPQRPVQAASLTAAR